MKSINLNPVILLLSWLSIISCNDEGPTGMKNSGANNRITLLNQSEHSGIMVEIAELDTFAVTDSTGYFTFSHLPDGKYTLQAKYPYFASVEDTIEVVNGMIEPSVQLELQQLIQFWIEPAETTIILSNYTDTDEISLSGLCQFRVNVTNTTITLGGYLGPSDFRGLVPQDFKWPEVSNVGNMPEFCKQAYGTFVNNDLTIAPANTFGISPIKKRCLQPGAYLFFSSVTDLSRNPEYFDARFIFDSENPLKEVYEQMNRSLYKKLELFRPAVVHIIE